MWRFIESAAAGFVITALIAITIPRMLRQQVRFEAHHPDDTPYELIKTNNPADIAIFGPGYFELTNSSDPNEKAYSRVSEFLRAGNTIQSIQGWTLTPLNNTFPLGGTIWADGRLIQQQQQPGTNTQIQTIQIALFRDSHALEPVGDGIYKPTELSGPPMLTRPFGPTGSGILLQGYRLNSKSDWAGAKSFHIDPNALNGPLEYPNDAPVTSERETDFGINGRGFMAVLLPSGEVGFTRYLRIALWKNRIPVREFPPTQPYNHLTYREEQLESAQEPVLFNLGLPVIRRLIDSDQGGAAAVRADPLAFAKPVSEEELDVVYITIEQGLHHRTPPFAFQWPGQDGFFQLNPQAAPGVKISEEFPLLIDDGKIPLRIPRAEYAESLEEIPSIQLYDFDSPSKLRYRLNGVYIATDESGTPRPLNASASGTIKAGFLNVVEALEP